MIKNKTFGGIKNNAAADCPILCPIAPSKLTEIKLTRLCSSRKNGSTAIKKKTLPPSAAKNGNDKSVPLKRCVNNNLNATIKRIFFTGKNGNAKQTGIFASPKRRNGNGVGIKLSKIPRNALIAASEAVKSFSFNVTLPLRQFQDFRCRSFL